MAIDNEYLQKKNTILIRALVVSGVINIIVLCLLSYWMIRERPPSPYCELKPQEKETDAVLVNPVLWADKLAEIHALSFNRLADYLNSNQVIGNTIYREKDIALACLIDFHHFDIKRALMPKNLPLNKHLIKWRKDANFFTFLTLYPNLKKNDFIAIMQFVRTERWPLTAEGLFLNLQKQIKNQEVDPLLIETLAMTSEFWSIELLLNRGDGSLSKQKIATLIAEGNWETLAQFVKQQRANHDLSDERRRYVLLEYVKLHSPTAAELLITLDWDYALKKMDDAQIVSILKLLTKQTLKNELFAKESLVSPRGELVWQNAASLLCAYVGEKKPEIWNYQNMITRFISSPISKKTQHFSPVKPLTKPLLSQTKNFFSEKESRVIPIKMKKMRSYEVQQGDTLWKISRKFNKDVEEIRKVNQLKSDSIKSGIVLKIPA